MTKRAILWCGQVKEPVITRDECGRPIQGTDPLLGTDDAKIQCNGLELAFRAALALGVPRNEVYACVIRDDLLPHSFDPQRHHPATVNALQRLVRDLARRAEPDDAVLFIAVNHCSKNALATADPVDEFDEDRVVPQLTPEVLDACLSQLPGPQVVVVATCYAGIFLRLGELQRRAIFVACPSEETYRVPREDRAWSAFLDELFAAWCGCRLSDAVPQARLSLDGAFTRAKERLAAVQTTNLPLRAGTAAWPP